jgi:hypothetical protein
MAEEDIGFVENKDCKFCGGHIVLEPQRSTAKFKIYRCEKCHMSNVVPNDASNSQ